MQISQPYRAYDLEPHTNTSVCDKNTCGCSQAHIRAYAALDHVSQAVWPIQIVIKIIADINTINLINLTNDAGKRHNVNLTFLSRYLRDD